MPKGKDARPATPCPQCGRLIVRYQSHRCRSRRLQCRECGLKRQVDHSRRCAVCAGNPYKSRIGGIPRPPASELQDRVDYYRSRDDAGLSPFGDPAGMAAVLRAAAEQRAAAAPAARQDAETFLAALCRQAQDALERVEPTGTVC